MSIAFLSSSLTDTSDASKCHDRYELLYVISGRGRFVIEGEELPVLPRSIFLTRPFEYGTISVDEEIGFERIVIRFDKSALLAESADILTSMLDESELGGIYYSEDMRLSDVDLVFDRLAASESLSDRAGSALLSAIISELIAFLSVSEGKKLIHSENTLFSRVTSYINSNIQRDLSLDTLSHRFFVSKYYLCREFKEQSGTSIHNYINQKRVLYAKQLIEAGETASKAAEAVGFGDYSAFYRAYIKYQGTSPASAKPKGGNL